MAFESLKKKVALANKSIGEKFSKQKSVNVTEDYRHLSGYIDIFRNYLEDVRKKALECYEGGGGLRLRPASTAASSDHPAKETHPHAESILAACLEKHGKAFDQETRLGGTLIAAGEAYREVAEAKTRAYEDAQMRFAHPIKETLSQEMKEITQLRKKAENRRMLFEIEQGKVQKGKSNVTNPEYVDAESKFQQAYQDSESAMGNFLDSEACHIELLYNFVCSQLSYYEDAQRVLSDLRDRIQSKLDDARKSDGPSSRMKAPVSPLASTDDPEIDALVDLKPKYDSQPASSVPTCRAKFDFDAENPFELSFKEGTVIRLLNQVDEHWFLGEFNGQEGHFPVNFVEVLVPLP